MRSPFRRRGKRFAWVADPPVRVRDLARVLDVELGELEDWMGSVAGPTLTASYRWDLYHEDAPASAADAADRELTSFAVRLPDGREECERALAGAYGAGAAVAARVRFGPFFVAPGNGDALVLEWYDEEPDWAKPPVDPARRSAAVAELARRVAAAQTQQELEAALTAVPVDAGLRADPSQSTITFVPPMPAREVAALVGAADAVARTADVHMASWMLAVAAGIRTIPPRAGSWELEAWLDGPATGPPVADVVMPAAAVRHLGEDDLVRVVKFSVSVR